MAKHVFKAGDLVRVPGSSASPLCYGHGLPQGAVCEVIRPLGPDFYMKHPELGYMQLVHASLLKPAKQAMRKREQYENRRG